MTDVPTALDELGSAELARSRILEAAAELIDRGGRDAATTRAIAAAAGVQPPTIYRLFGDKRGLLDAVAEYGIAAYVANKTARQPNADAMEDLRAGWDLHVSFGLTHPELFLIMSADPKAHPTSPALAAGREVLLKRVRRIATQGRLIVGEARAVALIQAAGVGTVLTLLSQPEQQRDLALSAFAREAVIAAITGEATQAIDQQPRTAATALHSSLDHTSVLTAGERLLLSELLQRIANGERKEYV